MGYFNNLLFIMIFSPILILLLIFFSLLVLIFDGNPIFFKQKRIGLNNKTFIIYKFRTMKNKILEDSKFNKKDDFNRISFLGYYLRKFSIDEIPEFYNILKNEMSLVGPRPLPIEYNEYFIDNNLRHSVLPGLTGLSQINGRNLLSWEKRFEFDNYYVKNKSLLFDLKIIFKTIFLFITLKAIINDNDLTSNELNKKK